MSINLNRHVILGKNKLFQGIDSIFGHGEIVVVFVGVCAQGPDQAIKVVNSIFHPTEITVSK